MARFGPPVGVFAISLLTAFVLLGALAARESAERRVEFERRAAQLARAAQSSFDVPLEVLRSLPALFGASDQVTRAEFRAFVSDALRRYPWIYALEWIPRVPGSERAAYEAAAVAEGLVGYQFKQDAASGPPVPATPRAEYYPLYYMEPPNPIALGIEETALDLRRIALERARDLGTTVITERLRLVQDSPSIASVIAFHPIYGRGRFPSSVEERRASLSGFAAAVFRIGPLLNAALRETDLNLFDVAVVDIDAAPSRKLIYQSRSEAFASHDDQAPVSEHLTTIANRRLSIRVRDRSGWVHGRPFGWLALLGSLGASVFMAVFFQVLRTVYLLRRQVRTARRLGQYTLVEKLGEGNMGVVYRAHHSLLRRPTAVKLLQAKRNNETAIARFEREVQLTSALVHPNTVVVYDYGRSSDGVFYYAMELIDGITLQDLIELDGPQPAARVVHVVRQVCAALAEAHGVGLVHRDIKPANIMLCDRGGVADFVKVLDFGLAKQLDTPATDNLSRPATIVGTPLYLSPEAISGSQPVDARMDIYTLAAVAYFMLSGTPMFTGKTVVEVCLKHLSTPPEPLAARYPSHDAPRELEELLVRCLAKNPAERPATVEDVDHALNALRLAQWTQEDARFWWRERGVAVTERLRAVRRAQPAVPTGATLEVASPSDEPDPAPSR